MVFDIDISSSWKECLNNPPFVPNFRDLPPEEVIFPFSPRSIGDNRGKVIEPAFATLPAIPPRHFGSNRSPTGFTKRSDQFPKSIVFVRCKSIPSPVRRLPAFPSRHYWIEVLSILRRRYGLLKIRGGFSGISEERTMRRSI
jgi:hypothetical protein